MNGPVVKWLVRPGDAPKRRPLRPTFEQWFSFHVGSGGVALAICEGRYSKLPVNFSSADLWGRCWYIGGSPRMLYDWLRSEPPFLVSPQVHASGSRRHSAKYLWECAKRAQGHGG